LDRLSSQAIAELNSSGLEDNSVTMAKLEPQLRADLNKTTARPFGASLSNPYGILGTPVANTLANYTVPVGKVLVVSSAKHQLLVNSKPVRSGDVNHISLFPEGEVISKQFLNEMGWTGLLFDPVNGLTPIVNDSQNYVVPSGKTLVICSVPDQIRINNEEVGTKNSMPAVFPEGTLVTLINTSHAWTGYLIDPTKF
jgi:hypothetical protein